MHFLISIGFLTLFMIVTFAYLVAGYFFLRGMRCLLLRMKGRRDPILSSLPRKKILFGATVVMAFYLALYVSMYVKWCGEDNAHLKAKQYFAVGQTLSGLRLALTKVLNPDNPILAPLNGLQRLIYLQGSRYLPENDGEIGVWNDLWFNYPYIQRMTKPYGTSKTEPSYRMRKLLDSIWFSMEQMSAKPFADSQMMRERYFQDFPRMAFYYYLNDGFYHDRMIGSSRHLLQDQAYVHRYELLYPWLAKLRTRWIENGLYEEIKKKRPKIEALRQQVTISALGILIEASIYPGTFSCDNPYILPYIDARREFTDPDSPNFVWKRLHRQEKQQAELIYIAAIDPLASSFQKYILQTYCGLQVPGEEMYYGWDRDYHRAMLPGKIKRLFRHELEILEEGGHAVR